MTDYRRIVNIVFQGDTADDSFLEVLGTDFVELDQHYGFYRLCVDDNLMLHLHNPSAEMLFDELWDTLQDDMLGFVILIESIDPGAFQSARNLLEMFYAHAPVPYIVAIRQHDDHPDAWDAEAVRIALRIPENVSVLPCVLPDVESVKEVVLTLLYEVLEEFED